MIEVPHFACFPVETPLIAVAQVVAKGDQLIDRIAYLHHSGHCHK
ncbi:hypothetical protein [Kosakonia radicincitans]|nr:hypothetical protein [Kosakonia radicincitans]